MTAHTVDTRRAIILGAGGHCRAVIGVLSDILPINSYSIEGIIDTATPRKGEIIMGVPVIGGIDELQGTLKSGIGSLILAIGDNVLRAEYFKLARELGFNLPSVVACNARVDPTAVFGDGNLICHRAHVGAMARIGDGNIINTGAILEHESTLGAFCHMAPSSVLSGRSCLGDFVFLGVNATVIDKIRIGSDIIIGAGAVVVRDILENGGTFAGVPARKIRP